MANTNQEVGCHNFTKKWVDHPSQGFCANELSFSVLPETGKAEVCPHPVVVDNVTAMLM